MKKILFLGLCAISAFGIGFSEGTLVTGVTQSFNIKNEAKPVYLKSKSADYLGEAKASLSSDRLSIRLTKKCVVDECKLITGYVYQNGNFGVAGKRKINSRDVSIATSLMIGLLPELIKSNDENVKTVYSYYQSIYFDAIAGTLEVDGNTSIQILEM